MTLIIGIICKDAIVLTADSQTTAGVEKKCGTNKINLVKFSNGNALVAESGSASLSNRVIELFQKEAASTEVVTDSTIAEIAEKTVRAVRSSLMSLYPGNHTPTEWEDFFCEEANYFELMVAYYFGGKPFLYLFNPVWCIPAPAISYFTTSGIASSLANYILKEHTQPEMDYTFASVIAIKAVRDAIEYVEGCGHPIKMALLHKPTEPQVTMPAALVPQGQVFFPHYAPSVVLFPPETEEIVRMVSEVETATRHARNEIVRDALRKQSAERLKEIMDLYSDEMPGFEGYPEQPSEPPK